MTRPETGLERTERLLRELDGKVVNVTVRRTRESEANIRRIAWEETQAQARWERQRARVRGRGS